MDLKIKEISDKIDLDLLKGIVICRETGDYLVDLILDPDINPGLLSSFAGALSMFGKENLGKIEEISIKGLDVDMLIVHHHNLILMVLMDKDFIQFHIREEAEKTLDMFYSTYQQQIKQCETNCVDLEIFEEFKQLLLMQVLDYFDNIKDLKEQKKVGDFGFFTGAIKKMREKKKQNSEDISFSPP